MTTDHTPDPATGPPVERRKTPWRRITLALLALLFLNGMLSFSTWWPTPGVVPDRRLAPEFVWLWLGLLGTVAWRGRLPRAALVGFTLTYLLLVLGRYADITTPSLFGRPINLYWDGLQIPRVLWVSAQQLPWWLSAGVLAAGSLLLWGLYRGLQAAIALAAREAVPYALRARWALVATAVAVALVSANLAGAEATWPLVSKPVIPTYWRQAQLLLAAFSPQAQTGLLPATTSIEQALAAPKGSALAGLRSRDVYLIMLESVGAVVYDNPRASQTLQPVRARFEADLQAGGRQVVSAFFRSPTLAGGSELAQLGVLSGIELSNPMAHDVLLTTQRPTLMTLFGQAGYQTFGFYPALRWEWPERAFYNYDVFIEGRDLNYPGPPLGYWMIPDQYSAARFEQMYPRNAQTPPRFVFFPLITCHLPFNPVPPYQPDWSRVLTAQPFDEADTARALAEQPNWLDMFADYLRMVGYTYEWLGSHLRRPEPRETVYLLVGDHQPAANVTGEGVSWDVPVHVVSSDPQLLARFVAQGFTPGMTPPRQALGGLHAFTGLALQAFAGPAPVPAKAQP